MTKLYLKYRHLPSLQACVSPRVKEFEPLYLNRKEVGGVKRWLKLNTKRESLPLILVEAGVANEEVCSSTMLDMSYKENSLVL